MTVWVDSNAGGTNLGTSWTDAFLTLESGALDAVAGEEIWVAHNHFETFNDDIGYDFASGTDASPIRIISKNSSTEEYASRGAHIHTSTNGDNINIGGSIQVYGMHFTSLNGALIICNNPAENQSYEDCYFEMSGSVGDNFKHAGSRSHCTVRNCTIEVAEGVGAGDRL